VNASKEQDKKFLNQHSRKTRRAFPALGPCSGYQYAYPKQTESHLRDWRKLVRVPSGCPHSRREKGCPSCEEIMNRFSKMAEAKRVLVREKR
ncbi:hypothetical protein LRR18_17985, partial [Mangrovimonas sp. AS39]|uniref:hypothetical protein n=1 Tax=Mangrovimonas futianensis TaxID=2895523 RepID=UPI001E442992